MTGEEVRHVITETNDAICSPQPCDLYNSNCYSASIFAITRIIRALDRRNDERTNQDIKSVTNVLSYVARNNYGRGVSNNSVVASTLMSSTFSILLRRNLLQPQEPPSESEDDPAGFGPF